MQGKRIGSYITTFWFYLPLVDGYWWRISGVEKRTNFLHIFMHGVFGFALTNYKGKWGTPGMWGGGGGFRFPRPKKLILRSHAVFWTSGCWGEVCNCYCMACLQDLQRGRGQPPPPPPVFENYKELLRKSVFSASLPPLWVTGQSPPPPPTLKVALWSLCLSTYIRFTVNQLVAAINERLIFQWLQNLYVLKSSFKKYLYQPGIRVRQEWVLAFCINVHKFYIIVFLSTQC